MVEKTRSEWRSKWGFFGWADGRRGARWFRKGKLRSPKPRAGGFHRLRLDEGLLTVSDRVVDPGQQRPSPRWGVARASCNARRGCAETRVRDVLGAYSSLGEKAAAAAREQRRAMGCPPGTNSAAVGREHGSATERPPGMDSVCAELRMWAVPRVQCNQGRRNAAWQEQGCTMGCLSVLDEMES